MRFLRNRSRFGLLSKLVKLSLVLFLFSPQYLWAALTINSHTAMEGLGIDTNAELVVGDSCNLDVGLSGISNAGTFTGGSGTISIAGNWDNKGDFTRNHSTILLNGRNQSVIGNTYFYNLTKTTTVADTLTFTKDSVQTIENSLTLTGTVDNRLSLRSAEPGTQWAIALEQEGTQTLNWLDVKDSDASSGQALAPYNSIDTGNNINWEFSGPEFVSMDPVVLEVGKNTGPDQEDGTQLCGPGGEGTYAWSSDSGIAAVSQDGAVTAIACLPENGKNYSPAWITVTDTENRSGSKLVKVFDHLSATPAPLEDQTVGHTVTLAAAGGTGTWLWETSDPEVATVVDGRVTFRAIGNAVITVKDGAYPLKFTPATIAVSVTGQGGIADDNLSFGWDNDGFTPVIQPGGSLGFHLDGGNENYTFSGTAAAWLNLAGDSLNIPDDAAAGIYQVTVTDGAGNSQTLDFAVPLTLAPYNLSILATVAGNDLALGIKEGSATGDITWTLADAQAMAPGFSLTETHGESIVNTITKADVDLAAVDMATAWIKITAHDESLDARCDVTTAMINVVPTNTLVIRAVDASGNPIAGARVEVMGTGQSVTMSGTEAATFASLHYSAGVKYRARVSAAGYLTMEQGDLAASGDIHDVVLPDGFARFTGIVMSGDQALEGATVTAFNADGVCFYSVTNADGEFFIDAASESIVNPWAVTADRAGYAPVTLNGLELGSGEMSLGTISLSRETRVHWAIHRDKQFAENNIWIIKMAAVPAFTSGDQTSLMFRYNVSEAGNVITNYGRMGDAWFESETGAICIAYEADPFDTGVSADFMIDPQGSEALVVTVVFDALQGTRTEAFAESDVDSATGGNASFLRAEIQENLVDDTGAVILPGGVDDFASPLHIRITRTDETAIVTGYQFTGGVYAIDLVDGSGNIADSSLINRILITFEFDPAIWVPYTDHIFYRKTGGAWTVFPTENILNVDYLNNTVTILSDHLSDWVLAARNTGGDDESDGPGSGGGGCFINSVKTGLSPVVPLLALLACAIGFLCRTVRIMKPIKKITAPFLILTVALTMVFAFTNEARADDTHGKFGAQIGIGYCYINNDVSTEYNAIDSDFQAQYSLYPVIRLDYRIVPQIALEADFAFNYYEWDLNNSLSDHSSHFYGYTFTLGPAIYSKKQNFPWLGQGIFYSRIALGWQALDMDLDFPVQDYDPAFGAEFALGFQKEKLDFRCGIKCYRHDAGSLANDFTTDSHNDSLDLSGIFFDVTWHFGTN